MLKTEPWGVSKTNTNNIKQAPIRSLTNVVNGFFFFFIKTASLEALNFSALSLILNSLSFLSSKNLSLSKSIGSASITLLTYLFTSSNSSCSNSWNITVFSSLTAANTPPLDSIPPWIENCKYPYCVKASARLNFIAVIRLIGISLSPLSP